MVKQNYAIIGLGRFGGSICRTLIESGQEVLAIDSNEDRVNEYMNIATHAVVGNAWDEMTLRSLGIRNFDHVIVAIGEIFKPVYWSHWWLKKWVFLIS